MAGSPQTARVAEAVAGLLRPVLEPLGLILDDVAVTPAGKRRLVRVSVDRDTACLAAQDHVSVVPPVSLDEVAQASQAIGAAMDAHEPLGEAPYVLEVTSPGVQRPLTEPRHYRRNVGRLVELALVDGGSVAGRLVAAGAVELTVQTGDDVRRVLPLAEIARGRVQVEFAHPEEADDETLDDETLEDEALDDAEVADLREATGDAGDAADAGDEEN